MKIKKFLPLLVVLLVFVAAFTMMTVSASAEEATPSDGITYTLVKGKYYRVTGVDETFTGTELIIPSTYKGLPVQAIGQYAFRGNTTITKVVIPDSVLNIGHAAFMECTALTDVTLSKNMKAVGTYMFSECSALTAFEIPEGVKEIAGSAFRGSSITSVTIPSTVTKIGSNAFRGCKGLTEITIPDTVTVADHAAFYGCSGLLTANIGGGIKTLPNYMFYNCGTLKTLNIAEGVEEIGAYCFEQCRFLRYVTLPDSLKTINTRAFYNCSRSLRNIDLRNVTKIDNNAFYGVAVLESIVLPSSLETLGRNVFSGCTGLTAVYYDGTAEDYEALTKGANVIIDRNIRYYTEEQPMEDAEKYWHYDDNGVPTIWEAYVEPPVEEPSDYTLSDDGTYYIITGSTIELAGATELVLPATFKDLPVKAIAANAFAGNTTLTKLVIGADVTVADGAFDGSAVTEIYFKGAVADWTCLTTATVYFYSETQPTVEGNFWSYVNGEIVLWGTAGDDDGAIELPPVGV